jgi:hypothetical protein
MKNRIFAGVVAIVTCANAHALTIDDFSQGTYSLVVNGATPRAEAVRNGAAIVMAGGQRDAMLEYVSGPLTVSAIVNNGGVNFVNTDSQTAGRLYLQYDGADGELETDLVQTAGTGLGLNLSSSNGFIFNFRFLNGGLQNPVSVTINVVSSNGTFSHTSNVVSGNLIMHSVMFSSFGGANFSDVRRLDFIFDAPASADFTLDSIITNPVPEPATMLALGGGLVLFLRRRRA